MYEPDAPLEFDVDVSSASGDATLDFNGHEVRGSIEMICKYRKGRISCPYDFDREDVFRGWDDRDRYVRKELTRESDSPRILIETASGRATLKDG